MNRDEIQTRVIDAAAEQAGVDRGGITPATHFVNDLNFDSLDKVEFAMEMEDQFSVSIQDDDVEKLLTVGEVVEYLVAHAATDAEPV
jgi:acyl carrier protein